MMKSFSSLALMNHLALKQIGDFADYSNPSLTLIFVIVNKQHVMNQPVVPLKLNCFYIFWRYLMFILSIILSV